MKQPNVIILRGLPASGKTSFAKNLIEKDNSYIRLNKDDLRKMSIFCYSVEKEKFIHESSLFMLRQALHHRYNVVIDDTNLNETTLNSFINVIINHNNIYGDNYAFEIKTFRIPVDECIKRDKARDNSVGEDVIINMYEKYKYKLKPDENG